MVATAYTAIPLPSEGMGKRIHRPDHERVSNAPLAVLGRNMSAAFERRGYSARSVSKAIGMSNKTVSNMLNGVGAPQLDKLVAVADYIRVPLWQLLCPSAQISQNPNDAMHELLEAFVHLSEVGQAQVRRTVKAELALAKADSPDDKEPA